MRMTRTDVDPNVPMSVLEAATARLIDERDGGEAADAE